MLPASQRTFDNFAKIKNSKNEEGAQTLGAKYGVLEKLNIISNEYKISIPDTNNNNICEICYKQGPLIFCVICKTAYHQKCIDYEFKTHGFVCQKCSNLFNEKEKSILLDVAERNQPQNIFSGNNALIQSLKNTCNNQNTLNDIQFHYFQTLNTNSQLQPVYLAQPTFNSNFNNIFTSSCSPSFVTSYNLTNNTIINNNFNSKLSALCQIKPLEPVDPKNKLNYNANNFYSYMGSATGYNSENKFFSKNKKDTFTVIENSNTEATINNGTKSNNKEVFQSKKTKNKSQEAAAMPKNKEDLLSVTGKKRGRTSSKHPKSSKKSKKPNTQEPNTEQKKPPEKSKEKENSKLSLSKEEAQAKPKKFDNIYRNIPGNSNNKKLGNVNPTGIKKRNHKSNNGAELLRKEIESRLLLSFDHSNSLYKRRKIKIGTTRQTNMYEFTDKVENQINFEEEAYERNDLKKVWSNEDNPLSEKDLDNYIKTARLFWDYHNIHIQQDLCADFFEECEEKIKEKKMSNKLKNKINKLMIELKGLVKRGVSLNTHYDEMSLRMLCLCNYKPNVALLFLFKGLNPFVEEVEEGFKHDVVFFQDEIYSFINNGDFYDPED